MRNNKPTVIYIMGGGRSGTTLLDIILGNGEQSESLGEIYKFPSLSGEPHGYEKEHPTYRFWNEIKEEFEAEIEIPLKELDSLADSIEYHTSFLKTFLNFHSFYKTQKYSTYINKLYAKIFEKTDAKYLIDSSKYPSRAIALSRVLNYPISFIYILRDPKAVVNSFQKNDIEQPSKSWFESVCYYFLVNIACKLAKRYLNNKRNVLEITYEQLVSDPQSTLQKIEQSTGINLAKVKERIKKDKPIAVGKLFEGNRIRMQDNLVLKKKDHVHITKAFSLNTINYLIYKNKAK